VYVVRDGVALGLDQGTTGDAWGYDIGAQRVTMTAPGLPWPHYFVDLSGVGGSADAAGGLVIIADCAQLAPATQTSPTTQTPTATQSPTVSQTPTVAQTPIASQTPTATETTPSPDTGQGCLRPELVALSL